MFPNNLALRKIAQKRSLEIVDLSPAELREVEEAEKQMQQVAMQAPQPMPMQPAPTTQVPQLAPSI